MRHLPADRRRQISRNHDLWALRQVVALRGSLQGPVGAHVRRPAGRADRLDQQISELGGGRSGEVGAGRLRRYPCRQPRREAQDLARCVDWAGVQPWSNGKVGLNGISYYAENQWQTAALQPKHLSAICIWEGAADFYRDMAHHGGIFCRGFVQDWSKAQVYTVQNGRGTRGFKSRMNGDWVSGPETLSEEELGRNRRDFYEDCISRKLDTDEYWQSRMPDWNKVKVPLLSTANWGGQGLHPRGNFEGFVRSASENKWLEVHGIEHWTHFYTNYGLDLQKRLFGRFLK